MAEHPTAVWIRELYAAFFAGDMETAGQWFTDDIVVHLAGRNPLSGTYHGKDQVFAMLAAEAELLSDPATETPLREMRLPMNLPMKRPRHRRIERERTRIRRHQRWQKHQRIG